MPGLTCDNFFEFCLHAVGRFPCLSEITTDDIEDDEFEFGPSEISVLGISNPLQFSTIVTTVSSYMSAEHIDLLLMFAFMELAVAVPVYGRFRYIIGRLSIQGHAWM